MAPEQGVSQQDAEVTPDASVRRVRRGSGERARRRRERRRARRWRTVRIVLAVAVAGTLAVFAGPTLVREGGELLAGLGSDEQPADTTTSDEGDGDGAAAGDAATDGRPTVLVATFDDSGDTVTQVQLFTLDVETGRGAVVLVPTEMVADVPGHGLLPLGDAAAFGDVPLLELTLENQLQVAVDATVRVTQQDWAALFSRVGGFEVDVAQPISVERADGSTSRRFEPGPQFLDGPRLAELLTIEVSGEDELTSFARVRQVLEGFLVRAGEDDLLDAVFDDGAPMLTTSDLDVVERTLRGLAGEDASETVALRTLPVTVMGSGDSVFYRLDDDRADDFVADVLGGTEEVPDSDTDGLRLEVLNGNGRAGIGADVAELLVPLGHTIAKTGNAEDFDHPATRVLVYSSSDDVVAAAQQIVDTLGVGRIEVSQVPSSVVDITVLVGADFTR